MPRRSKLTPERVQQIVEYVAAGNYFETAVRAAGLHPDTAYNWLQRGEAERQRIEQGTTTDQRTAAGLPPAATERRFADFSEAIERARAQAEADAVEAVRKQIRGGWVREKRKDPESGEYVEVQAGPDGKLALEYLSRVAPKRYGRRQLLEVTGADGGPVGIDATVGARLAARLEDYMRRVREADPRVIEGELVRPELPAGTGANDERGDEPEPGEGARGAPDGE